MVTYPSDWEISKIKKIADITTGCRDTQDNKSNGKYPCLVRSPIVESRDISDFDCEALLTAGMGSVQEKYFIILMANLQHTSGFM